MLSDSFTLATFADLAATAVPAGYMEQVASRGFAAKRMDPMTGRALECLAHAIAYLEEANASAATSTPETVASEQAVRVLKGLNRRIFAELPDLPERRSLLRCIVQSWEILGLCTEEVPATAR